MNNFNFYADFHRNPLFLFSFLNIILLFYSFVISFFETFKMKIFFYLILYNYFFSICFFRVRAIKYRPFWLDKKAIIENFLAFIIVINNKICYNKRIREYPNGDFLYEIEGSRVK